jgi:hypothetical protein
MIKSNKEFNTQYINNNINEILSKYNVNDKLFKRKLNNYDFELLKEMCIIKFFDVKVFKNYMIVNNKFKILRKGRCGKYDKAKKMELLC